MLIINSWYRVVAAQRRRRRCRVLLIDETSLRCGHRYVTVIINGDTGETIGIVKHRNAGDEGGPVTALSRFPIPCDPEPEVAFVTETTGRRVAGGQDRFECIIPLSPRTGLPVLNRSGYSMLSLGTSISAGSRGVRVAAPG